MKESGVTLCPDSGPWERSQEHEAAEKLGEETTLNEVDIVAVPPVSENKEVPLSPFYRQRTGDPVYTCGLMGPRGRKDRKPFRDPSTIHHPLAPTTRGKVRLY